MEELTDKPKKKKDVDWDAIEPHWRAGIKTKLQLSNEFGVSRAALDKHFAKLKIERNLAERIREQAEALVTLDAVTPEVTAEQRATENEIILANAELQANIVRSHRKDITRYRGLCESLLHELELQTGHLVTFEQLNELMQESGNDAIDKLTDVYRKVIATPSRVDSVKKLSDTLKVLIGLERQAFGIADNANGEANKNSLEDLLQDAK
jgi:hypothetical protein